MYCCKDGSEGLAKNLRQLRPDLSENANVGAVDHVRFEELKVAHVSIAALECAHVLDLLKFLHDEWCFAISFGVNESEDVVTILPAVLAGEPSTLVSIMYGKR